MGARDGHGWREEGQRQPRAGEQAGQHGEEPVEAELVPLDEDSATELSRRRLHPPLPATVPPPPGPPPPPAARPWWSSKYVVLLLALVVVLLAILVVALLLWTSRTGTKPANPTPTVTQTQTVRIPGPSPSPTGTPTSTPPIPTPTTQPSPTITPPGGVGIGQFRIPPVNTEDCGHNYVPVDVDRRTVHQRVGFLSDAPEEADLYRYDDCLGNEKGLYFAGDVFFGRALSARPSKTDCEASARSGGTDEPFPPAEYSKKGATFCIVTVEQNVALLTVTSVEGRVTDESLPAVMFDVKLWAEDR